MISGATWITIVLSSSILRSGRPTIRAIGTVLVLWFGVSAIGLFEQPEPAEFLERYFLQPFVASIIVLIAWYVSSFRSTPERTDEYRLLNSLPLNSRRICYRLVIGDLVRHSWVAGLIVVINLGLLAVSPLAHLIRLGTLAVSAYIFCVLANFFLNVSVSVRGGGDAYAFPDRNHPIIIAGVVLAYGISQITFSISISLVSSLHYVIVVSGLALGSVFLLEMSSRIFGVWRSRNVSFSGVSAAKSKSQDRSILDSRLYRSLSELNPFWLKEIVRLKRETNPRSLILALGIVGFAYLVVANNDRITDSIAIIYAAVYLYLFIFSIRSMNEYFEMGKSDEVVFSLPIKKISIYTSSVTIAIAWFLFVITLLAAIILLSGGSAGSVALFVFESSLTALVIIHGATCYGLASCRSPRNAMYKFISWLLVITYVVAVAGDYRIVFVCLAIVVPLLDLRQYKQYRIA